MSRFDRQLILPGFGQEGQDKLRHARVLVVGAGGLGCPALLYLAAAGVGAIGIADGDTVTVSNLNRQVLYGPADVGRPKAETAATRLKAQYPDVSFEALPFFLSVENALNTISRYDLVVDGSDNFSTRYLVNDACVLMHKPLVLGAIYQYEGQIAVLNAGPDAANYRDLYPVPPTPLEVPNCSETGVLGVLPGIIGVMQAAEAIKLLAGVGTPLIDKALFYDLRSNAFFETAIQPHPDARAMLPQSAEAFKAMHYAHACAGMFDEEEVVSLSWPQAFERLAQNANAALVDIREPGELPHLEHTGCLRLPMSRLLIDPEPLENNEELLLFCRSGVRSVHLAQVLQARWSHKQIFSIEGGVLHPLSPLNSLQHGSQT